MSKIALIALGLVVLAVGALLVFVYVVQNVEQPEYTVLREDGDFELRYYPALTVAQVRRGGARKDTLGEGFGPLARYIFAKERDGERIAMTAPVIQQPARADTTDGDWTVGFIMPKAAVAAGLPQPANADVRLVELPPRQVAAVRFSGRTTDARTTEERRRLQDWISAAGLRIVAPPIYAYYNDPMTPGPLRRNEILYDVAVD